MFYHSRRQNSTNQTTSNSNNSATINESTEIETPASPSIQCNIVQQRSRTENGSNNNSPTCKNFYFNIILIKLNL